MKGCLIIFAKEPEEGRVKTRLQGHLTKNLCVDLYKAFLRDTLALAEKITCEHKILAYASRGKNPRYLKKIAPYYAFYEQKGACLGERMHNAFKFAKGSGASRTVIIGSDSPSLPASLIKKAFSLLGRVDLVLGPSLDGGYYLIGLKSPCVGLFKGIMWSSPTVLKDTIRNAQKLKKSVALLDKRYDVDDARDLFRLKKDLSKINNKGIAKWTRKFMNYVSRLTDKNDKTV
jgi:rSAM/selenodomain-associated transferase 1